MVSAHPAKRAFRILLTATLFMAVYTFVLGVFNHHAEFSFRRIQVGENELLVKVAQTEAQRAQGLSEIDALTGFDGMLFVFDQEGIQTFWMLNTKIPLTIAFYDAQGSLINVYDMAPELGVPPNKLTLYSSLRPARYALEIPTTLELARGLRVSPNLKIH
jgi:uncharacterized membrane protein (UPF0127 family)